MQFLGMVLLIFPGALAAVVFSRLQNKPLSGIEFCAGTAVFSFFITSLNYLFLWLKGYVQFNFDESLIYTQSVIKYAGLSLLFALLLPFGINFLISFRRKE